MPTRCELMDRIATREPVNYRPEIVREFLADGRR
jgi:hypothetical protein